MLVWAREQGNETMLIIVGMTILMGSFFTYRRWRQAKDRNMICAAFEKAWLEDAPLREDDFDLCMDRLIAETEEI